MIKSRNLPSLKEAGIVVRAPLRMAALSMLMSRTYDAVLSLVSVPPWRPEPYPPTTTSAPRFS